MPSYFVTQPNGLYARWSTIVDGFCEVDMTEEDCKKWYREKLTDDQTMREQWQRVIDDVIPRAESNPCCDEKPLRRWHDCLDTILHVHGTKGLAEFLAESPSVYTK